MQMLTELVTEEGAGDRILSDRQLDRLVGGGAARRYGLVNRALKADELIRIRRGLYVLPERYRSEPVHPFAIAQAVSPGSYVSFETALSFHGWIPEGVRVVASTVPGRKSLSLEHEVFGSFTFHPLAIRKEHFLELILRHQLGSQSVWVANPLRALLDLVTLRKVEWQGLAWIADGLRVDVQALRKVTRKEFRSLADVYQQQRSRSFLEALAKALKRD